MTWKKVPDDRRFRARLIDGTTKEYTELRIGDVFQAIDPSGDVLDPGTGEPDDEVYARVVGEPEKNITHMEGYAVPILVGSLDELRKVMN